MNEANNAGEKPCLACSQTIDSRAEICPKCGVRQFFPSQSSYRQKPVESRRQVSFGLEEAKDKKLTAGICAILLGSFGVHKFILGYRTAGIIMLTATLGLLFLTMMFSVFDDYFSLLRAFRRTFSFGTSVVGLVGMVEGVLYLIKSDEEFYDIYIKNDREWF